MITAIFNNAPLTNLAFLLIGIGIGGIITAAVFLWDRE